MRMLITGSTYWNPGDDAVRHGAMRIFEQALMDRFHMCQPSWFLHSFSHPDNRLAPCHEDLNLVYTNEVFWYARKVDYIVVPGLAAGAELQPFFAQVHAAGCGHKLVFIGGMNENDYCKEYCGLFPMPDLFKQAKVVISRTSKCPDEMREAKYGMHTLPCPSVFSAPPVIAQSLGPVLFSMQLGRSHPQAVVNHSTSDEASLALGDAFDKYIESSSHNSANIIAHHKSEALIHYGSGHEPAFFAETHQIDEFYQRHFAVASNRLHAVLKAHAMGIPTILVNDSERHTHAMKEYPHIDVTMNPDEVVEWLHNMRDTISYLDWRRQAFKFKESVRRRYLTVLGGAL